ncbi:MAG: haloalkane dehalogenase [Myxococcota bacterium]
MDVLRTPDERFENLPGYDFDPHYVEVDRVRIHYVDEGPRDADPVLLMHGEPSWSYLYRTMIPPIAAAGRRVLAPDLVGFGRSDKPTRREDYTYAGHLAWMTAWFQALELRHVTLFCQDWGGLLGLRMVAAMPERFDRVVVANTFLPTGNEPVSEAFDQWRTFSQTTEVFDIGRIINSATTTELTPQIIAAYDAPFPDETYKAGARQFPALVPTEPDAPGAADNRDAWQVLRTFSKPFLCAFSDGDPITRGANKFFERMVPGAKGQAHVTIDNGGHFLQEDQGPTLATVVNTFIDATPR